MSFDSVFGFIAEHIAGTTTQLDSVQTLNITQGRANLSDSYRSAVMTLSGRNPDDLPNIKVGDQIKVTLKAFNNGSPVTISKLGATRARADRVAVTNAHYHFLGNGVGHIPDRQTLKLEIARVKRNNIRKSLS